MPQAVGAALTAVLVSVGINAAVATAVSAFIIRTATSFLISAVVGALTKPKTPASPGVQQQTLTVRQPTAPRKVVYGETRVGGTMVYADIVNDNFLMVVEWAGHECESIEALYFDDETVVENGDGSIGGKYAGYAWAWHHLGAADQAADANIIGLSAGKWGTGHRLRGRCYTAFRFRKNQDLFPGIPNVSVVLRGKKVYDPRSSATAWSRNPALCAADWLTDTVFGLGADYATEINESALIASANVCDEDVALGDGTTEKRYQCDGAITSETSHKSAVAYLTGAMAGAAVWRTGTWWIEAGAYKTPTVTLTAGDFRAPLKGAFHSSRSDLFNAVRGTYISDQNQYQPADFPAVTNALYESQDNGQRIYTDIDLPMTRSPVAAQRIAKIMLERARQQMAFTAQCRLSALRCVAGGVVNITYPRFGWDAKPFEVERWRFVVYDSETGPALGVDMDLREIASAVFDWNAGEETTVDLAPNTNLPGPRDVATITGLALASGTDELLIQADGTVVPRIKVAWDVPTVVPAKIEVQHRRAGVSAWQSAPDARGNESQTWIAPVKDGVAYDVQVRAVNYFGVASEWVGAFGHVVTGKSAPPSNVTDFRVSRQPDGTREFSWAAVSDVDVAGYLIKYASGLAGTWGTMAPLHKGLLTASPWETNQLAAGDYTVGIVAVDTSGNESVAPSIITSTLGDPRIEESVYYLSAHGSGWPGTLTDCALDQATGYLTAVSGDTWNDLTTWDAWTSWAQNPATPITWTSAEIDLGAVLTFAPLVTARGSATPTIETRTSADGSTWGGWGALPSSQTARYVQYRVRVAQTASEIPQIFEASVLLSGKSQTEYIVDSATSTWSGSAAAGRTVPITKSYGTITTVQLALQSVGAGYSWEVLSKSAAGPVVRIYDNTGTATDATVDVFIRGTPAA